MCTSKEPPFLVLVNPRSLFRRDNLHYPGSGASSLRTYTRILRPRLLGRVRLFGGVATGRDAPEVRSPSSSHRRLFWCHQSAGSALPLYADECRLWLMHRQSHTSGVIICLPVSECGNNQAVVVGSWPCFLVMIIVDVPLCIWLHAKSKV